MTNTDSFLSTAGRQMQESAIRKMGTVLASGRDVISFAPGYPDPQMFPWDEFAAIAAELLTSRDERVLQYGPTRGYRPLRDGSLSGLAAPARISLLVVFIALASSGLLTLFSLVIK